MKVRKLLTSIFALTVLLGGLGLSTCKNVVNNEADAFAADEESSITFNCTYGSAAWTSNVDSSLYGDISLTFSGSNGKNQVGNSGYLIATFTGIDSFRITKVSYVFDTSNKSSKAVGAKVDSIIDGVSYVEYEASYNYYSTGTYSGTRNLTLSSEHLFNKEDKLMVGFSSDVGASNNFVSITLHTKFYDKYNRVTDMTLRDDYVTLDKYLNETYFVDPILSTIGNPIDTSVLATTTSECIEIVDNVVHTVSVGEGTVKVSYKDDLIVRHFTVKVIDTDPDREFEEFVAGGSVWPNAIGSLDSNFSTDKYYVLSNPSNDKVLTKGYTFDFASNYLKKQTTAVLNINIFKIIHDSKYTNCYYLFEIRLRKYLSAETLKMVDKVTTTDAFQYANYNSKGWSWCKYSYSNETLRISSSSGLTYYANSNTTYTRVRPYPLSDYSETTSAEQFWNFFESRTSNICRDERGGYSTDYSRLSSFWSELEDVFNTVATIEISTLKNTDFLTFDRYERYQYIVNKYHELNDFLNLRTSSSLGNSIFNTNNNSAGIIAICAASILAISFVFVLKAKKECYE